MSGQKRSGQRGEKPNDVVFWLINDSRCEECHDELGNGRFLRLESGKALCLSCADLDHLDFLAAGDAALTRRSVRYSKNHCVVVRWSRTRKRYERQGVLVEAQALQRAEEECLADAEVRQRRREREAERRGELDEAYVGGFAAAVRAQFPGCPGGEEQAIAERACLKHSGRVGRSAAAKEFDAAAIFLAVQAHIRHHHTQYDHFLYECGERALARDRVRQQVEKTLERWRK
jgi:hypothetical protein